MRRVVYVHPIEKESNLMKKKTKNIRQRKKIEICAMPDCERPIFVKMHRLCKPHAERYYKYGSPGTEPIRLRRHFKPFELTDLK